MTFFVFSEGDLRVIRPMIYVRERELRKFAEKVRVERRIIFIHSNGIHYC